MSAKKKNNVKGSTSARKSKADREAGIFEDESVKIDDSTMESEEEITYTMGDIQVEGVDADAEHAQPAAESNSEEEGEWMEDLSMKDEDPFLDEEYYDPDNPEENI